jgi:hypothetical protein
MSMCRFPAVVALLAVLFQVNPGATDGPKDKKAELKKAIAQADLILVGKVTRTGLGTASSFDVGIVEAKKVLKGDEKIKSVKFKFASTGSGVVAPYGKVGVEGVWVLAKKGKPEWRDVLSFQPLTERETVKTLINEEKKREEKPKKDQADDPSALDVEGLLPCLLARADGQLHGAPDAADIGNSSGEDFRPLAARRRGKGDHRPQQNSSNRDAEHDVGLPDNACARFASKGQKLRRKQRSASATIGPGSTNGVAFRMKRKTLCSQPGESSIFAHLRPSQSSNRAARAIERRGPPTARHGWTCTDWNSGRK